MTRRLSAALALVSALCLALPAFAQVGIPGSGPLTPDGPRRGIGPPSITDSVPDLRLQPSGGSSTYTPPGVQGSGYQRVYGGSPAPRGRATTVRTARQLGRHCQTPRRVCAIGKARALESSCQCRLSNAKRVSGFVVR